MNCAMTYWPSPHPRRLPPTGATYLHQLRSSKTLWLGAIDLRSVFSGTSTRLGKISRLVAPCKYSKPLGDSAGSARSSDQKQSRSTGFSLHSRLSGVGFTYFQKAPRPSYASRGPMKTGRICHPPAPPLHPASAPRSRPYQQIMVPSKRSTMTAVPTRITAQTTPQTQSR